MGVVVPYEGGAVSRNSRKAARVISRNRAHTQVRMANIDDEADTGQEKIEAISAVTGSAMSAVTRVAQAQRQLELLAPEAAGRLAFLADAHALTCGDVLNGLRHRLERM